jgi:hypothetical protein
MKSFPPPTAMVRAWFIFSHTPTPSLSQLYVDGHCGDGQGKPGGENTEHRTHRTHRTQNTEKIILQKNPAATPLAPLPAPPQYPSRTKDVPAGPKGEHVYVSPCPHPKARPSNPIPSDPIPSHPIPSHASLPRAPDGRQWVDAEVAEARAAVLVSESRLEAQKARLEADVARLDALEPGARRGRSQERAPNGPSVRFADAAGPAPVRSKSQVDRFRRLPKSWQRTHNRKERKRRSKSRQVRSPSRSIAASHPASPLHLGQPQPRPPRTPALPEPSFLPATLPPCHPATLPPRSQDNAYQAPPGPRQAPAWPPEGRRPAAEPPGPPGVDATPSDRRAYWGPRLAREAAEGGPRPHHL